MEQMETLKMQLFEIELNSYIKYKYGVETFTQLIDNIVDRQLLLYKKEQEKLLLPEKKTLPNTADRSFFATLIGVTRESIIGWEKMKYITPLYTSTSSRIEYNTTEIIDFILKSDKIKTKTKLSLKENLKEYETSSL